MSMLIIIYSLYLITLPSLQITDYIHFCQLFSLKKSSWGNSNALNSVLRVYLGYSGRTGGVEKVEFHLCVIFFGNSCY